MQHQWGVLKTGIPTPFATALVVAASPESRSEQGQAQAKHKKNQSPDMEK
jgi:hypothetical protein